MHQGIWMPGWLGDRYGTARRAGFFGDIGFCGFLYTYKGMPGLV